MDNAGINSQNKATAFRRSDYFKINIFGFALNALWNPMSTHIMPLIVLSMVAESQKNTYLGIITFAGLILAIIVQPLAGALSDRYRLGWGKRSPYILIGAILAAVLMVVLGRVNTIVAVLIIYCLLQIASNMAHGPWQGFIPDLVPDNKRGMASGIKSLMEILGAILGIQLVGYLVSERFAAQEDMKILIALSILALVMVAAMIVTVVTVKEKPIAVGDKVPLSATLHNIFRLDLKKDTGFIYFLISRLLFLLPLLVLRTFGLYFLRDMAQIDDPTKVIADLTTVIGISLFIVVYPAGYLADKIGRRGIIIASGIIGAVGVLIMTFLHTYLWIMAAGAFIGIANGIFMSASWALATDLVPKGEEARYLGLTNLATGGGAIIAAAMGPFIDIINTQAPVLGYQVILVICTAFLLVSSILVLKIKVK